MRTIYTLLSTVLAFGSVLATTDALACKADFTYSVAGSEITFTNLSTGGTSYQWDFGDGNVSTTPSPIHTYGSSVSQTYNVQLVVIGASCRDSIKRLVTVYQPCEVIADFSIVADTLNYSAVILNKSFTIRPQRTTWTWHFGDGDSSNSVNPSHIYPGVGGYELCLVMVDTFCYSMTCDSLTFDSSGALKRAIPFSLKVLTPGEQTGISHLNTVDFLVSPNPVRDELTVRFTKGTPVYLRVLDMHGKELFRGSADAEIYRIRTSSWKAGLYILQTVDTAGQTRSRRFIRTD